MEALNKDNAGVKIIPPLVYIVLAVIGGVVEKYIALPIGLIKWPTYIIVGWIVVLFLVFMFYIFSLFRKERTELEPWKTTSALITYGPYRYSRNPIYVAFFLVNINVGLLINSYWPMLMIIPTALIVYHMVIKKEEAYLETKFGQEYLDYKALVRRWL